MTRDDIIRMAREAHCEMLASMRGMYLWHDDAFVKDVQDFCGRFAAIAIAAERKACAEMVDHILREGGGTWGDAIRARGEEQP